jgi:hypothetical protein
MQQNSDEIPDEHPVSRHRVEHAEVKARDRSVEIHFLRSECRTDIRKLSQHIPFHVQKVIGDKKPAH